MPELISLEEARARVLGAVAPLGAERVALAACLGRFLGEDVVAGEDLPPFDASAMDGYAVVAGEGAELPVVGESRAGAPASGALEAGQAMRISTGAVMPAGADAVVPVERVTERGEIVVVPAVEAGANVRSAGEDMRAGERVLAAGAPIGPAELAVLASVGQPEPLCGRRPRVAVLATGDELVEPGAALAPGQIRNSNAFALAAQAERAGAEVVLRERVPDAARATRDALRGALEGADVVCVSGGVSVGPHDYVKPALAELGVEQRFWGVRLKPGKPTWFGSGSGSLVFGLPGNPVSAMVTFHLFARPALIALAGGDPAAERTPAILDTAIKRSKGRDHVVRCRLTVAADGLHVEPTKAQNSHVLSSMLGASAFGYVPAGDGELVAGDRIDVELL